MSKTKTDMPKVTQMLDTGWHVRLFKSAMGDYAVEARHANQARVDAARMALVNAMRECKEFLEGSGINAEDAVEEFHFDGDAIITSDFTPQQALTRMAYKIFGEII